MKYTKHLA